MQYYIPKMLPEYVEVEPDVFQPYSDATVAGWRNEQRMATQQGKHQRAGVAQMVLFADKFQIAESVPLHPYLVKLGDLEKFRFLLDRQSLAAYHSSARSASSALHLSRDAHFEDALEALAKPRNVRLAARENQGKAIGVFLAASLNYQMCVSSGCCKSA